MPRITTTCCNPACGVEFVRYWNPRRVPPKYCSAQCSTFCTRTFDFTEAMNDAIRAAYRSGYGYLKALWRDDPRFAAVGISYALVKRQVLVLRLRRVDDLYLHRPWAAEELEMAQALWARGSAADVISIALRKRGWQRTPGAVIAAMEKHARFQRHNAMLSTHEVAEGLGVDMGTVLDWAARGWLQVHHMSDGPDKPWRYFSWVAVRRFVVEHPAKVAHGKPDIVFLIGLLSTPSAGDTTSEASAAD